MTLDSRRLANTLDRLTERLLAERNNQGHWEGDLSSSALSTATASIALSLGGERYRPLAQQGIDWLIENQNPDGGWGDTIKSKSNISTTALCWAALNMWDRHPCLSTAQSQAEAWLQRAAGGLDPASLSEAIKRRYGVDHTFSAPILTVLAIAGLLGNRSDGWRWVPQLPFELAAFPQQWYRWLRLPVVSYALPALIAIGQARHWRRPSRNLVARGIRNLASEATLRKLTEIQPASGGFLEATPLTSFVVMSLITAGYRSRPVAQRGLDFLERSMRPDGSWPIDTNLATWVTTLSVNALAEREGGLDLLGAEGCSRIRQWLLNQQYRERHPYTGADPGGWAWTDLPGGVPDADDTPGALLVLRRLGPDDSRSLDGAAAGVRWLLGLQNSDGGIPTFCRGWGKLPFDRSSPDLTAHALRAWSAWRNDLPAPLASRVEKATERATTYLGRVQLPKGAWRPLWFGNEHAPGDENLTYGTARVLEGLAALPPSPARDAMVAKGAGWLMANRNSDGGWGGVQGAPSSIEETALAISALTCLRGQRRQAGQAVATGVRWLIEATNEGRREEPSPIGFYFAKLWYFEKLYPRIFAVEALARASRVAGLHVPGAAGIGQPQSKSAPARSEHGL